MFFHPGSFCLPRETDGFGRVRQNESKSIADKKLEKGLKTRTWCQALSSFKGFRTGCSVE